MHEGAALLLAEMPCGGVRDVEAAEQMHLDDELEVDHAHAVENAVAQDAGIVDHAVDPAECIERGLDDVRGGPRLGDAVEIGDRLAAVVADFVDHFLGRRRARALTFRAAAEVVDHNLGAFARRQQRDLAADAAPGAGDHDDFSRKRPARHVRHLPELLKDWRQLRTPFHGRQSSVLRLSPCGRGR